ncbi:hypothetical protein F2Q69_00011637 [Brassica cretica]|uniref:Uncharacterized protein n=1 Tax=Brassica cretica TaxID=69181 RepID=A0A8S9R475_BRACR|nr:hypothetical protein F2Q69_00011637 [Brassica cretica]
MLQFPPVPSSVSRAPMVTLNMIVQLFFEVVTETSALVVLEVSLVPFFFLKSVGVSMEMLQHEESDFTKWGEILLLDSLSTNDMVENYIGSLSESFPIPLSCHLLNLILNAAFKVPGQLQRWRILQLFPPPCYFQGILFSVFSEDPTSRECVHIFKEWHQEKDLGMLKGAVLGWINREKECLQCSLFVPFFWLLDRRNMKLYPNLSGRSLNARSRAQRFCGVL